MKKEQTSGIHLWLVLWKAYDSLRRQAEKHIASLPLGMSEFAILEALLHKGPLPVNTLGGLVRLTSGSASVAIDRLEKKGLVQRKNHPHDRRTRVVHLTATGRKLIRSAFEEHAAAMEQAAASIPHRDRVQLVALLKKLGFKAAGL